MSNLNDRSEKALRRTLNGTPFSQSVSDFSLNCLQNSAMLIPSGPRAWPMAGPGRAVPDGTRSLTWRTKDITNCYCIEATSREMTEMDILGLLHITCGGSRQSASRPAGAASDARRWRVARRSGSGQTASDAVLAGNNRSTKWREENFGENGGRTNLAISKMAGRHRRNKDGEACPSSIHRTSKLSSLLWINGGSNTWQVALPPSAA